MSSLFLTCQNVDIEPKNVSDISVNLYGVTVSDVVDQIEVQDFIDQHCPEDILSEFSEDQLVDYLKDLGYNVEKE